MDLDKVTVLFEAVDPEIDLESWFVPLFLSSSDQILTRKLGSVTPTTTSLMISIVVS